MNRRGRGRGRASTATVRQEDLDGYMEMIDNRFGMMDQLRTFTQQPVNLGTMRPRSNPNEDEDSEGSDITPSIGKILVMIAADREGQKIVETI